MLTGIFKAITALSGFLKCLILWLAGAIIAGVTTLANAIIAGLAALVQWAIDLFPDVNLDHASPPSFVAYLNYVFPIDHLVIALLSVIAFLGFWQLGQLALRWAKAIR